jgi:lysine 2,3-aminomutase
MVATADQLAEYVVLTAEERSGLEATPALFRVGATPYYASLMDRGHASCPIRRQIIPSLRELDFAPGESRDPLGEEAASPTARIFHKYPDRVLLMVLDRCAIYCRHCNRRRAVGGDSPTSRSEIDEAISYIERTPAVRDVLLSGGDPLLLSTSRLEEILARLRAIPHVEILRIGTRVPVVLPMRVDAELAGMLRRYHPLFVNTHFNHPKEITAEARAACELLVDHGIPVGNQTVLLRGVNSSVRCLRALFRRLLTMRVKPYYLFQGDTVLGTDHLRTRVETAIELYDGLRGWVSGMAIPHLVIDAPGGGGKIPIGPEYLLELGQESVLLRNYRGERIEYPQPRQSDARVPYDDIYFASEPE